MSTNKALYPRHDVNPAEKVKAPWLLQYAKAALGDAETMPETIFWRAAQKYQELRDYAMGRQSVDKYKPILGLEETADESWMSIDWSTRPAATKFLDIAVSKILQREFRITATPIDALARTELDKLYARDKAKLMLREEAELIARQTGDGTLLQSPALRPEPGDPEDLEELEMKRQYNMKLNVAIEAEQGVELVFYQNDIEGHREKVVRDLVYVGAGGYKEWIDENGQTMARAVHPDNVIISFCRRCDFKDAVHVGELIEVPLVELSKHFEKSELEIICNANKGKLGNPHYYGSNTDYNQGFDGFKAQVLDLEILSDDVIVYERRVDKRGNLHVGRGKWERRNAQATIVVNGKEQKKFVPRTITNVYRVKWVVGTDLVYDYGLAHNMKREPCKALMGRTTFSYHLFACGFDNMRATSLTERLRPLIDDYHITHYKLQNLKNRMTPSGWAIDLDALESVDLTHSGEAMPPLKVLELLWQTGLLVYRGSTLDNSNPNRKPVEQMQTQYGPELVALVNELERIKQEMRDVTGLNEVTDGSTPSDRMLNGVASLAAQSTNNALYPIMQADKRLLESLAKGVVMRLQIAVKQGNVEGIVKALGEGTVRHIRVTNAIAPHIWGIMIQDVPTEEERQLLLQQLNLKDAQGQIDPEDVVTVYNIHNIKEARQYLAYKVKKRRKEAEEAAIRQQEMNNRGQILSARASEEEKRKTLAYEYELKVRFEEKRVELEARLLEMKLRSAEKIAAMKNETALTQTAMSGDTQERLAGLGQEAAPFGDAGGNTPANMLDGEFPEIPIEDEPSLEELLMMEQMQQMQQMQQQQGFPPGAAAQEAPMGE